MSDVNILLIGPPGSGKTHLANSMSRGKNKIFLYMNENVLYENLVEGTQAVVDEEKHSITYETRAQKLAVFLNTAKHDLSQEYFVIMDDINRSNLIALLGELVYAFKERGKDITLKSGNKLQVSSNVVLIVTLNSAEVVSINSVVEEDLFDKIIYLSNDRECLRDALANIRKTAISGWTPKEYSQFEQWLFDKYDKYTNQYCLFTREYRDEVERYRIGMSYFLPSNNCSPNRWMESVYHKIRHQVHPLLYRYASDGIIKKEEIPSESINDTEFVNKRIKEDKISIHSVQEYLDYENDFESGKPLPIGMPSKANSSHSVNWQYVVLSVIIRDMIENSLINQHDLLDMLTNDSDILTFRNDLTVNGRNGGCLFVEDSLASSFPVKDNASGNTKGGYSYSANYYKFFFKGKTYRMFSAWRATNKVKCPYAVTSCIETDAGIQKRHLYRTLKMLVLKYLKLYESNLNALLVVDPLNENCQDKLKEVQKDISLVEQLTDDKKYVGKEFHIDLSNDQNARQFIEFIRNLSTWKNMKKECGVYRTMSNNYKDIMEVTGVKQMILQGPPGTSKTFGAKKFIADQASISGDNWEDVLNEHQLITNNDKYEMKNAGKSVYWDLIQFHPSYTYEDFVRGISVKPIEKKGFSGSISGKSGEKYEITLEGDSGVAYKSVNRAIGKIAELARSEYEKDKENCADFYLVIDEINRANLATVFGELIYAFEYRGEKGAIRTPYEINGDDSLVLPPNLYIIGTMNTADKSIGTIDYAIRRRFLFFKLLPEVSVIGDSIEKFNPTEDKATSIEVELFCLVEQLFENCLNKQDYEKEDVQLGHTYFLRKTNDVSKISNQAKYRFIYQVVPILFEYKKDGVIDISKVEHLSSEYEWKIALQKLVEMIEAKDTDRDELFEQLVEALKLPEINTAITNKLGE